MKKDLTVEEKIKLLEKEIGLLGDDIGKMGLDLEEGIDLLRIEIESLKIILKELVPDFKKKFNTAKNTALREIDPEWPNKKSLE